MSIHLIAAIEVCPFHGHECTVPTRRDPVRPPFLREGAREDLPADLGSAVHLRRGGGREVQEARRQAGRGVRGFRVPSPENRNGHHYM